MTILGIETSCDETSAAVITTNNEHNLILRSQETATSLALHAATGGIIPERAAREQLKFILPVLDQTLMAAFPEWDKKSVPPIDVIAVTYGPGLIGSLLVGVETAKTLAFLWNKPIIPVNHLYGHIYANWLRAKSQEHSEKPYALRSKPFAPIAFPALALVVSGGHTDLVLMENHEKLKLIGGTRDDAAGEAFDKIGRLLGLPYPAGPVISRLAEKGNPKAFHLPRPMHDSKDFDFSFSGLKTAVLNLVKKNGWEFSSSEALLSQEIASSQAPRNDKLLSDLCASVQQAIVDVLVMKTIQAAKQYDVQSILLGGGVAANDLLREQMKHHALSSLHSVHLFAPAKSLCTDNAAMIAAAAYFNQNITPWKDIIANPELYF